MPSGHTFPPPSSASNRCRHRAPAGIVHTPNLHWSLPASSSGTGQINGFEEGGSTAFHSCICRALGSHCRRSFRSIQSPSPRTNYSRCWRRIARGVSSSSLPFCSLGGQGHCLMAYRIARPRHWWHAAYWMVQPRPCLGSAYWKVQPRLRCLAYWMTQPRHVLVAYRMTRPRLQDSQWK